MVVIDMGVVDTKTNTKCFKDPMYAIFLKISGFMVDMDMVDMNMVDLMDIGHGHRGHGHGGHGHLLTYFGIF